MLQHIVQSNLIEGIDDPNEDAQSIEAWAWLLDQSSLDHNVIRKVQEIITKNQPELKSNQRGYYRDEDRVIPFIRDMSDGSIERVMPPWTLVKGLMDNWLLDYRSLGPKDAHIRFERIHPFVDGNGRTGRMLMWWHERMLGLEPTLIKAEEKEKYYEWFRD